MRREVLFSVPRIFLKVNLDIPYKRKKKNNAIGQGSAKCGFQDACGSFVHRSGSIEVAEVEQVGKISGF